MVSTFQIQPFYGQQASLKVGTRTQNFFDEEDCILDDNILEHNAMDSGLELSPAMTASRRDSFAVGSSSLFSPKQEDWQSVEMQSCSSNNPFMDQPHSNNPFFRVDQHHHHQQQQQQQATYGAQSQWSMDSSGSATPLQPMDSLPAEYDTAGSLFQQRPPMGQTPFSNPTNHVAMFSTVNNHTMGSDQKDSWTGANAMARKTRPNSPVIRSHNELRRGDGIRKKNARFEIPAERNLSNIDQLIGSSTDENEIKELKQQKRLLRNRQAALDSRQRKKQHTERLEDEKKQFNTQMQLMDEKIADMEIQIQQLMRDNHELNNCVETLKYEKDELISAHTIETGELRKKISVLTNTLVEGGSMSTSPAMFGNGGYGGPFGEMGGLPVDSAWDNMGSFGGDFAMEQAPPAEIKQDMSLVLAHKKAEITLPSDEKSVPHSGLLFMAFLIGIFCLSKQSPPALPTVSEDVRAASATILENVLQDAGVVHAPGMQPLAPQPSATSWGAPTASHAVRLGGASMDTVAPSMLGELSDSLTQPTQEQTNEQLFGLTPAQYNGVNAQDFLQNPPPQGHPSQSRKNLAEALASMRKSSKAEVYTRSLLWDQIPGDVVRTFAKMVSETQNGGGARQPTMCGGDVNT